MRKLPIGISSFSEIRRKNLLYVDKTGYIHELEKCGSVFLLSRPRRSGKSLLLSTMRAYYEGRTDLFEGLSLAGPQGNTEPWTEYPVISISFADGSYRAQGELEKKLNHVLSDYSARYDLPDHPEDTFADRLHSLIRLIAKKTHKGVVLLIDEYDRPLLESLFNDPKLEWHNRGVLKGFFSALKEAGEDLKFVFITGLTGTGKTTVFSDLTALCDISLDPQFSGICGFTGVELRKTFAAEIDRLASAHRLSWEDCMDKLEKYYGGYHFCADAPGVYQPFGLLSCLDRQKPGVYSFEESAPAYLARKLRQSDFLPREFAQGVQEDVSLLSSTLTEDPDLLSLLFASGYLTIESYDPKSGLFDLRFPNREAEIGWERTLDPLCRQRQVDAVPAPQTNCAKHEAIQNA